MNQVLHYTRIAWLLFGVVLFGIIGAHWGGPNPGSRFAMAKQLATTGSPELGDLKPWTIDWSYGANGIYSNKAPLPAYLAAAYFWVFSPNKMPPTLLEIRVLCFFLQILPFALLALWADRILQQYQISEPSRLLAHVLFLFGNTASVFLSTFFGHAMAAAAIAGAFLAILTKRFAAAGFLFGVAVLSDYMSVALIPAFFFLLLGEGVGRRKALRRFVLGGVPLGIFFIWYHLKYFSSPITIATLHSDPILIEGSKDFILPMPSIKAIYKLWFGAERGLLHTQPWVLLCWAAVALRKGLLSKYMRIFFLLALPSATLLVAFFPAWHGGNTAGPRYLSVALPVYAWGVAWVMNEADRLYLKFFLLASAAIAIMLFVFTIAFYPVPPVTPLWRYYISLFHSGMGAAAIKLFTFYFVYWLGFLVLCFVRLKPTNSLAVVAVTHAVNGR